MVYLYAVTEGREEPLEALRGVDYGALSYVQGDGLTAVVSFVDEWTLTPTPRRLWQHEQVVESFMAAGTVLPMRFSTIFADPEAIADRLVSFKEVYQENLERLHGCVELSLRAIRLWEPNYGGDGMAGGMPELAAEPKNDLAAREKGSRAFDVARRTAVLQRRSNRRRNEDLAELINQTLARFSQDQTMRVEETSGLLIKATYLVEHGRQADMQQAVQRLMRTYPNLHFLCTGPWPPYHFVEPMEPVKQVA